MVVLIRSFPAELDPDAELRRSNGHDDDDDDAASLEPASS